MHYKITVTCAGGLSEHNVKEIAKYFAPCNHAYVVNEFGELGSNSHLEVVAEFDTECTSNITERMRKLYVKLEIDYTR